MGGHSLLPESQPCARSGATELEHMPPYLVGKPMGSDFTSGVTSLSVGEGGLQAQGMEMMPLER